MIHFYNLYHVRINEDISIKNIFKLSIIHSVYKFQILLQNNLRVIYCTIYVLVKLIYIHIYISSTINIAI